MTAPGRPKGLRVRTDCSTESQFIAVFHHNCDEGSVFAPTEKMLPVGADCAFSLELADGQPMLRGLGVVMHSWPSSDNRFARAGVQIAFMQLTSASEPILQRLLTARADAAAAPRRTSPTQRRIAAAELAKWPEEESVVRDVRRSITQERQAHGIETAAPVLIDDRSNQTERYEGPLRAPAIPARKVEAVLRTGTTAPLPSPHRSQRTSPPPLPKAPDALPPIPTSTQDASPIPTPIPVRGSDATMRATPLPPGTPANSGESAVAAAVAAVPAPKPISDVPKRRATALLATVWATIARWFAAAGERFPRAADRVRAASAWIARHVERAVAAVKPRVGPLTSKVAASLRTARSRIAPTARRVGEWIAPRARRVADWSEPARERLATAARAAAQPRWRNARIAGIFAAGILVGVIFTSILRSEPKPAPAVPVAMQTVPVQTVQCAPTLAAIATPAVTSEPPAKTVPPPPKKKKLVTKPARVAQAPQPPPTAKPIAAAKPVAAKPLAAPKPAPVPAKMKMAAAKQSPPLPAAAPRKKKCETLDCI